MPRVIPLIRRIAASTGIIIASVIYLILEHFGLTGARPAPFSMAPPTIGSRVYPEQSRTPIVLADHHLPPPALLAHSSNVASESASTPTHRRIPKLKYPFRVRAIRKRDRSKRPSDLSSIAVHDRKPLGIPSNSGPAVEEGNQAGALYKDGRYMGNAADIDWGTIQVVALIKDGRLSDVQFLVYPYERHASLEINGWALPILQAEAIEAQSAKVDIVSQASFTSYGFRESLASALVKAKK